jgi:hypothetical protein
VQVEDLGAVDQALAGEGDHVRLLAAPGRQRGGPLVGAAPLQDFLAGVDHRAVHGAGKGWRHLAGHDRHHRLVEQHHALAHPPLPHRGAAVDAQRDRDQVGVGEAPADRGRTGRRPPPLRVVTGHHLPQRDRQHGRAVAAGLAADDLVGRVEPGELLRGYISKV